MIRNDVFDRWFVTRPARGYKHCSPMRWIEQGTATVIKSFKCKETEQLHQRRSVRKYRAIEHVARRKLTQLDSVTELRDLAAPPGNRLEALRGERKGQYSIRINDQWHVCFVWRDGNALDVEIVDYH